MRIRIKVSAGATFLCPEYIWQQLMMANCDLSGMEGACQVVNVCHWVGGLIQQKSSKTMEDQFSSVQLHSRVQLFTTPWTSAHQAFLSITNSWSLLKLKSMELVISSNQLILCLPFSSCLQSFPSSGSFQMRQFFTSGGQSIGVSASTSVLMNIQD